MTIEANEASGKQVIEYAEIRPVEGGGTAIAMESGGSLRRLMVLSFRAIMLSAEKPARVSGAPSPGNSKGPHPPATGDSGATLALDNRVRTLSTDFGAEV
jgi:hypothetical protein